MSLKKINKMIPFTKMGTYVVAPNYSPHRKYFTDGEARKMIANMKKGPKQCGQYT